MTKKHEDKGHDKALLDIMRSQNLFAVETRFKPKAKMWAGRKRRCNATYVPKHVERRPTKLDYFLVRAIIKSILAPCLKNYLSEKKLWNE